MLTFAVYLNLYGSNPIKPHKPLTRDTLADVRMACRKRHSFEGGVLMVEVARDGIVAARAYCHTNSTIGHAYYEGLANLSRAVGIERFECAQRYRRARDYAAARHILAGARELFSERNPLP